MEPDRRTFVLLLCMHRSGSSLTANILQELGMSLGEDPLVGPAPSNIYGHFESEPLQRLNRRLQELAFGFLDDSPTSEPVLSRFLEQRGAWPQDLEIPDSLLREGSDLLARLIDSGRISGFKDPRTVLTWPFWRRVLASFPSLRVVVVPLLRSPHEIAMSLCTRTRGAEPYWACLDVTAVHFLRIREILATRPLASNVVRFGTEHFREDLAAAARFCGLEWNEQVASKVFDRECVHQEPAVVLHEAQTLHDEIAGCLSSVPLGGPLAWVQARDARKCERMTHERLQEAIDAWRWHEAQQAAARAQADLARGELSRTRGDLARSQDELRETQAAHARTLEELARAQERGAEVWEECLRLRSQRDRYEAHPVLGQILRARRRVKHLLASRETD